MCHQTNEINIESIKAILSVKDELANIYFTKGADEPKPISPTETILSKIMLGTLGCVPAYDRYFIDGLKQINIHHSGFNESSIIRLFNFIDNNNKEIEQAQKFIKTKTQRH